MEAFKFGMNRTGSGACRELTSKLRSHLFCRSQSCEREAIRCHSLSGESALVTKVTRKSLNSFSRVSSSLEITKSSGMLWTKIVAALSQHLADTHFMRVFGLWQCFVGIVLASQFFVQAVKSTCQIGETSSLTLTELFPARGS